MAVFLLDLTLLYLEVALCCSVMQCKLVAVYGHSSSVSMETVQSSCLIHVDEVRLQVPTDMTVNIALFWDVTPCSVVCTS
jgi:hypothetical protein